MGKTGRFPPILFRYWVLSAGLFAIAVFMVLTRGKLLHLPYPYNTFLFDPTARFSDYPLFQARLERFGHPEFFAHTGFAHAGTPFNYPSFMAIVLLVFYRLPGDGLHLYLGLIILAAGGSAVVFARSLTRRGAGSAVAYLFALSALLTSFPLMVLIDRLNFEGLVWIVLSLGLLAFLRERFWWAATLVALAAAMKIFPAVLLALLLSRRKWPQFIYGVALAAGLTLASLWLMGPSIGSAWHALLGEQKLLYDTYVLTDRKMEFGFLHSLFFLIRQVLAIGFERPDLVGKAFSVYFWAVPIAGLLLYFTRIRKLPMLNQMIALTTCAVLLPWWSGDYTLIHLYVPWALLVLWIIDHSHADGQPFNGRDVLLHLAPFVMIALATWVMLLPQWEGSYTVTHLKVPWVLLAFWAVSGFLSGKKTLRERAMLWYLAPFAILFTPQSYLIVSNRPWGGQVKALALLVLLLSSICIPLKEGPQESPQRNASA